MKVSVIIPVYNAERFVASAVESALQQSETGEVLVVEDGSRDRSLSVCERLARENDRVQLLRHPGGVNRGAAASRNVGIRAARCDLIAFLDADDFFLARRFERATEMLAADPTLDGVYEAVGTQFESDAMREWWTAHRTSELTTMVVAVPPERLLEDLITYEHGFFCTGGIVVRRRLFERTGLFDVQLRMCQDTAMWLKMAAVGRLAAGRIAEPVAMRRMHGENRIVTNHDEHTRYGYRMAWTLLRWGIEQELDECQLASMVWQVVTLNQELARERRRSRLVRAALDAALLARLVTLYPPAVRAPAFGEMASALLPGLGLLERLAPFRRGNPRSS